MPNQQPSQPQRTEVERSDPMKAINTSLTPPEQDLEGQPIEEYPKVPGERRVEVEADPSKTRFVRGRQRSDEATQTEPKMPPTPMAEPPQSQPPGQQAP